MFKDIITYVIFHWFLTVSVICFIKFFIYRFNTSFNRSDDRIVEFLLKFVESKIV